MQANSLPYSIILDSPIGMLGIKLLDQQLSNIDFVTNTKKTLIPNTALEKKITAQLQNYFADPQFKFDLPLQLKGTPFQQKVWQRLQKIPMGTTITYGELAAELKTSARAIGNACRTNPVPLVIPCHRIVAKNGLGGFSGKTSGPQLTMKKWLLAHEGQK